MYAPLILDQMLPLRRTKKRSVKNHLGKLVWKIVPEGKLVSREGDEQSDVSLIAPK